MVIDTVCNGLNIVDNLSDWLGSLTNFKRGEQSCVNLFYIEQTVTMHIVLFYMWTQMFYWFIDIYLHFNTFCVLYTVKVI